MSKPYFNYHIKITFDKSRNECNIGLVYAQYSDRINHKDTFVFQSKELTIIISRSKIYKDGSILNSNLNTIYNQIIKALLYYYSLSNDFPEIKNIEIVRKRFRLDDYSYSECNSGIIQPIVNNQSKTYQFNKDKIKVIFEETEKGKNIRIALSYWLKGVSSNERYYKFEHLWRALNRLFMYHGNLPKEVDCMASLRTAIINNEVLFRKTITITNSYTTEMLRSFRWRQLILNDYDTLNKTKAFHDFILRYKDKRIMDLFNSILPYRSNNLNTKSLLNNVTNHINRNMSSVCDAELVTILSLKYAYFVRNKMFHGEIPDSTFKLHETNEDIEIDRINDILSSLIFELIDNNNILR